MSPQLVNSEVNKKPVWLLTEEEKLDDTTVVFNRKDLLEFAEGKVAPVFGPQFSEVDILPRRMRLPTREYLLISNVTKLNATPNQWKPGSYIVTEYDIPIDGEFSRGGQVPWALLVEAGQCEIMLVAYMGVDLMCKGKKRYRLLDTLLNFYGVAKEGDKIVYEITVKSFAKGPQGDVAVFFYECKCYCNGKLLLEMLKSIAGFFTDEELESAKGVTFTKLELKTKEKRQAQTEKMESPAVKEFLINPCWAKMTLSEEDMKLLVQKRWDLVLGQSYDLKQHVSAHKMLMIDRVTHIDPSGGAYGLGLLVSEKDITADHWCFGCHFIGDGLMAGSLISDGCAQLMKVYLMWLGFLSQFDNTDKDAIVFHPTPHESILVRCRGQIGPHTGKIVHVMEVKEIGYSENKEPYIVADVNVIDVNYEKKQTFEWNNKEELVSLLSEYGRGNMERKIAMDFRGCGLMMKGPLKSEAKASNNTDQSLSSQINGHASDKLFWHPFYNLLAKRPYLPKLSFQSSKQNISPRQICFLPFLRKGISLDEVDQCAPIDAIFNPGDRDFTPGKLPLNFYNLSELRNGSVSNCFGEDFKVLDNSECSRSPTFELALVTRVVSFTPAPPGSCSSKSHRSSSEYCGSESISEFDCPEDAWFLNSSQTKDGFNIPYSVLLEIGVQAAGLLTFILKTPLVLNKSDVKLRNLNGQCVLGPNLKCIDVAGQTIVTRSKCLSFSKLGNMVIQKFHFELSLKDKSGETKDFTEGEIFFSGETTFGWFSPEAITAPPIPASIGLKVNDFPKEELSTYEDVQKFIEVASQGGTDFTKEIRWLSERSEKLQCLTSASIGNDYAYGRFKVDPNDWFFNCHFWSDPVMPGSLGVESMFELLEVYSIHHKVGQSSEKDGITDYRFRHCDGEFCWKYSGPVTRETNLMEVEIMVTSTRAFVCNKYNENIVEIVADGKLYADSVKVQEVTGIRLQVVSLQFSHTGKCITNQPVPKSSKPTPTNQVDLKAILEAFDELSTVAVEPEGSLVMVERGTATFRRCVDILPVAWKDLGDSSFMSFYGVKANLYTGSMAKGISGVDFVSEMGHNGFLSSFGAVGLPLGVIDSSIKAIKVTLKSKPFAVNLLHSPMDQTKESDLIDLLLEHKITIIEAYGFTSITESLVRYRATGLSINKRNPDEIILEHKVIAKCSSGRMARQFLNPAPIGILDKLLGKNLITQTQHRLAQLIPLADDITVEADCAGVTSQTPVQVTLPLVQNLRDELYERSKSQGSSKFKLVAYAPGRNSSSLVKVNVALPLYVRVGVGGGIGCPEAAMGVLSCGADFIVTGSINQMCKESSTSSQVKGSLSKAAYSDVCVVPLPHGPNGIVMSTQVLKKGKLFSSRATKLNHFISKYSHCQSLDDIPHWAIEKVQRQVLYQPLKDLLRKDKQAGVDTSLKTDLRWLSKWYNDSSFCWAVDGNSQKKLDYQIWCGPCIGSFNNFIKGSFLDPSVSGEYPSVVDVTTELLNGVQFLRRVHQLKISGIQEIKDACKKLEPYKPRRRKQV